MYPVNVKILQARPAKHRRPKLNKLKGKCSTGKIRYRDIEEARATLRHIKNNVKATADNVVFMADYIEQKNNRKETRAYKCSLCKGAHLTSWETFTPKGNA